MLTVTFVIAAVIVAIAAVTFAVGLVRLARDNPRAEGTLSAGLGIGLCGVIAAAIVFGFFA